MKKDAGKIMLAGDWHMSTAWATHMIDTAGRNKVNTIVHVGDFGYTFSDRFLDGLQEALVDNQIDLYFVDGNHEDFHWLYDQPIGEDGTRRLRPQISHLPRGYTWDWEVENGRTERWLALGGGYSIDRKFRMLGESWWIQEVISTEELAEAAKAGKVDVMVTHDCPAGVFIPTVDDNSNGIVLPYDIQWESDQHRKVVRDAVLTAQPKILYHGHYHVRYDAEIHAGDYSGLVTGLNCDGKRPLDNIFIHEPVREIYSDERDPGNDQVEGDPRGPEDPDAG